MTIKILGLLALERQASSEERFLSIINQIIEDNIGNENFSVEDLAQKAGLSRSMLHRKLKSLTGKSASDHISEKRLSRAKELLENDVATVSEIAFQVGYSDPSYFSKVFQKHYHISPGKVRKNVSEKPEISSSFRTTTNRFFARILLVIFILIISIVGLYYILARSQASEKSLAVLPLANLTGLPENAYFVDGMHDALIGELGQIESLRVISRTSTLRYRNGDMLLKDIANELGVNTIVEGSVMGAGDSVKLLIQLIDVFPEERHILVNEYQDDMHNVLKIQTTFVKDIAQKIKIRLSKDEEQLLTKIRMVDPETYRTYLKGMYYLNQGNEASFERGINTLTQAIERDPGDPCAYAGLALGYAIKGHGMIAPEESFRNAEAAANRALRIDPTLDEAHTALALLNLYQFWDWPMAQKAFEDAIFNNQNNDVALAHFAWYFVLAGDLDKAINHAQKSVEINPHSASYHSWLAWLYYMNGEYDKAEIGAKKSLELQDNIPYGNLVLGWTYLQKKLNHLAVEVHEKLPLKDPYFQMLLLYTYTQTGDRDKALSIWTELKGYSEINWVNPFYTGMMAAYLGFPDRAFELLNEACDHKYYPTAYVDIFPCPESFKDDPRYQSLKQKMNLPE